MVAVFVRARGDVLHGSVRVLGIANLRPAVGGHGNDLAGRGGRDVQTEQRVGGRLVDGVGHGRGHVDGRVGVAESDENVAEAVEGSVRVELEGDRRGPVVDREPVAIVEAQAVDSQKPQRPGGDRQTGVGIGADHLRVGQFLSHDVLAAKQPGELVVAGLVNVGRRDVVLHGDGPRIGKLVVERVKLRVTDSRLARRQIEVDDHAGQAGLRRDGLAGGRIDADLVPLDLKQIGEVLQAVGTHQADEVRAVARVEPDLGPLGAQPVGAGRVARRPVHRVVLEDDHVAQRVVFDVDREGVSGVGVVGAGAIEVAHVDPIDLDVGVAARAVPLRHLHLAAHGAVRIRPRVHVGPEGSHNGCRLREPLRREFPQSLLKGEVAVVVDVELGVVVAVELESEAEIQQGRREIVVLRHVGVQLAVAVPPRHQHRLPGAERIERDGRNGHGAALDVPHAVGVEVVELPAADRGVAGDDRHLVVLDLPVRKLALVARHVRIVQRVVGQRPRGEAEPGKGGHRSETGREQHLVLVQPLGGQLVVGEDLLRDEVAVGVGETAPTAVVVHVDPGVEVAGLFTARRIVDQDRIDPDARPDVLARPERHVQRVGRVGIADEDAVLVVHVVVVVAGGRAVPPRVGLGVDFGAQIQVLEDAVSVQIGKPVAGTVRLQRGIDVGRGVAEVSGRFEDRDQVVLDLAVLGLAVVVVPARRAQPEPGNDVGRRGAGRHEHVDAIGLGQASQVVGKPLVDAILRIPARSRLVGEGAVIREVEPALKPRTGHVRIPGALINRVDHRRRDLDGYRPPGHQRIGQQQAVLVVD